MRVRGHGVERCSKELKSAPRDRTCGRAVAVKPWNLFWLTLDMFPKVRVLCKAGSEGERGAVCAGQPAGVYPAIDKESHQDG